jgi:hypothetical protein
LIVFLNFYLLCFCNSSPDLQFLICTALTNIASRIIDQTKAVVSAAAVAGHFFVGLPHQVGDTLVNSIYFFI